MPQNKDLKRLVRARMAETGERYTQALTHVLGHAELDPLPAVWRVTGSRAADYELERCASTDPAARRPARTSRAPRPGRCPTNLRPSILA